MTQPNNVEGDYNTDIDYGTIDGTQTQSPFATSGPNEVIFIFILTYYKKNVTWLGNVSGKDLTSLNTGKVVASTSKQQRHNNSKKWMCLCLVCGKTDAQRDSDSDI